MSKDRSVSTDALSTLGTLELGSNPGRDAIHLAVEPVIAGETLHAGQDIGIVKGRAFSTARKKLGIVDPFIKGMVMEGEQFWLIVYPRQITSLRHVWEHPDFTPENLQKDDGKANAEDWLRNWCSTSEISYDDLVDLFKTGTTEPDENGNRWSNEGEYLLSRGFDSHGEISDEVFDHLEIIIDRKISDRPTHFSCSC